MQTVKKQTKNFRREDIEQLRENFLEKKNTLWSEILEILERTVRHEHNDLIQTIRDEGDVALSELRQSTVFSLIEVKHRELQAIENALQRIEEGKYGYCQDCGRFIPTGRLEIMPYAVRCRECQERAEKIEKATEQGT